MGQHLTSNDVQGSTSHPPLIHIFPKHLYILPRPSLICALSIIVTFFRAFFGIICAVVDEDGFLAAVVAAVWRVGRVGLVGGRMLFRSSLAMLVFVGL